MRVSVNDSKPRLRVAVALGLLTLAALSSSGGQAGPRNGRWPRACDDPVLTALFTPPRPQLGRYEVCTTVEALTAVARPDWIVETVPPLDAFGAAGPYSRPALARVYGSRRATVARGWTEQGNRFESLTAISPHPDATLTRLLPGTLIIRHVILR